MGAATGAEPITRAARARAGRGKRPASSCGTQIRRTEADETRSDAADPVRVSFWRLAGQDAEGRDGE